MSVGLLQRPLIGFHRADYPPWDVFTFRAPFSNAEMHHLSPMRTPATQEQVDGNQREIRCKNRVIRYERTHGKVQIRFHPAALRTTLVR